VNSGTWYGVTQSNGFQNGFSLVLLPEESLFTWRQQKLYTGGNNQFQSKKKIWKMEVFHKNAGTF
jgi:hypothetical protein